MEKYLNRLLLIAATGVLGLASCKKDETRITFQSGTPPVLTASVSDSIALNPADSAKQAVAFTWTNPNYSFSNGISSMNVTYNLEIDTLGANFTNPNMVTVAISPDLGTSFTVTQFNGLIANTLQLSTGSKHTIQVRVVSLVAPYTSGSPSALPLTSNAITFTVTPFSPPPAITPPSSGTLFIVGSATFGGSATGWDNPISHSPATAQQFAQVSATEYKITIPLIGGGEYKFIGTNGSWGEQWSVSAADTYPNGGPFVFNGANCIAPGASGTYIIDVNFQTGKFTVTPQ